ncbi:hypothetical protein J8273_5186 [Carpediemonas membranifera]|uniref:Uncharacterized protein n=1 Tax=Carpediemonas membranifera TaxID=201153 RepID=A0A8J6B3I5_9EUKA|nr:hypothetical protein J8273_5186 [Carpediemonas membranifera]|eukprot:KAG9392204.1 hypothetical protein J8273_5186 [Carpediemonas membranifera]
MKFLIRPSNGTLLANLFVFLFSFFILGVFIFVEGIILSSMLGDNEESTENLISFIFLLFLIACTALLIVLQFIMCFTRAGPKAQRVWRKTITVMSGQSYNADVIEIQPRDVAALENDGAEPPPGTATFDPSPAFLAEMASPNEPMSSGSEESEPATPTQATVEPLSAQLPQLSQRVSPASAMDEQNT